MHYLALATDYDGTLAWEGTVEPSSIASLRQLVQSGRKAILVTGRRLDDVLRIFPDVALCDRVIAENGAVLYRPATREHKLLGSPPPSAFIDALRQRGVSPLEVGHCIVATLRPHEVTMLEVIRDLGLELHVIFNRESVMVLPSGINKGTGLMAALNEIGLSPHNVVAVGDSENDHALLHLCEYAVAVANAVPMLKDIADRVMTQDHGRGVAELIGELVAHDLGADGFRQVRRRILLGTHEDGRQVSIPARGVNVMVAGSSGSGKSTVATGILERLAQQGYQFCVIDPEGDYEAFSGAVVFGNAQRGPAVTEILTALERADTHIIINLVGLPLQDRPAFFLGLLPALQEWRAKLGRPHWILVDETHHLLPSKWQPTDSVMTPQLSGMVFVTVHPGHVAKSVLNGTDVLIALGEDPAGTIAGFCDTVGVRCPEITPRRLATGEALCWNRSADDTPFLLYLSPCETDRRRHRRKYAEGELPVERSFFFRGPKGSLNLRAQNLILFSQIADGVDEDTWLHHLRRGDYSKWMLEGIKDPGLAEEVRRIERLPSVSAEESRCLVREAIEQLYTIPSTGV